MVPAPGVRVEDSLERLWRNSCLDDGDPLVIYLERVEAHREDICAMRGDCE